MRVSCGVPGVVVTTGSSKMGARRHLTWCWGFGDDRHRAPLSRAYEEVFMGWSGELTLLGMGYRRGGHLSWAVGGRPQVRERGFLHSVSKYYAPYSGAGSAPGAGSSCDVLGAGESVAPMQTHSYTTSLQIW